MKCEIVQLIQVALIVVKVSFSVNILNCHEDEINKLQVSFIKVRMHYVKTCFF